MHRRQFIQSGSAAVAGLSLLPTFLQSCMKEEDSLRHIGIITNVVKEAIKADHRATMSALAAMGYRYLEFGGSYGEEVAELRSFLEEINLKPLAGGSSMHGLQGDGLKRQIEACLEMGKSYLICYWPWMDGGDNPSWDKVNFAVDDCNRMAAECKAQGLRFAWHNHDQEFARLDDRVIYDYVLEKTTGDVDMEIDLYWAHKGGADVRLYFKKYPGRFPLVHVKDSLDSKERDSFCCVGEGIIDFEDLLSYRDVAGFKHLIIENDRPPADELGCARSSIDHLLSLNY